MVSVARFLLLLLRSIARSERWVFIILGGAAVVSLAVLLTKFYFSATMLVPKQGGTYIEGSVGELTMLSPWFTVQNDVNRDIVSLVFSGLLRYNPTTEKIEDDLATMQRSGDGRVYTLTLKDNVFWHDSTAQDPHPVTADDVLFTFRAIQDPQFPNSLLHSNFQGIVIEKTSDRAVQFRLEEPYNFFPSNLTIGLLPRRAFDGIPVSKLDQTIDFGLHPVGAGPYKFKTIVQTELSTEVTLERFERTLPPAYRLERIVFRIFPEYVSLLSDLHNLDGIRLVARTEQGEPVIPQRFVARTYTLPQYVALFFNLDRKILQDAKLRLGMQLGTNKQEIADTLHERNIVDTPLLELANADWRYKFDPASAQGALFESQWYFPEKVRLQRLLEQREANSVGPLTMDPIILLESGAMLTITGSLKGLTLPLSVQGIPLREVPTATGSWSVTFATDGGTGSLRLGENLLRLTNPKGKILDSFYLWRTTSAKEYKRAAEEQRLVDVFLASKTGAVPKVDQVTVASMVLDNGFLRKRTGSDPIGVRVNDLGKQLRLTLLTSPSPPQYATIAKLVGEQWRHLGIAVNVEIPDSRAAFEERVLKRDYDILLFGQSLLENLDSYPYWGSSNVQKLTGNRSDLRIDAYNLSQYASFEADALLEEIRGTPDGKRRFAALGKLQEILKNDVPAIILYSPEYTFAHNESILGIELQSLSLHSDRFLTLANWYAKEDRVFRDGKGWTSFLPWLVSYGRTQ